jgi:hypothetical protein
MSIGTSSAVEVVLGMGSSSEFSSKLVLELVMLADGPIPSSPSPVLASFGPESSVQAFGSDAFVAASTVTLGSTSLVVAFGLVSTLVLFSLLG